jgi:NADH dehydrogenase
MWLPLDPPGGMDPGDGPAHLIRLVSRHRVVIVGGGFGGLYAAKALRKAPVELTLVDRRNFHLFQPLLYQVATGGLSPGEIASPLRAVLSRQRNAEVLLAEVVDFDVSGRQVILKDGAVPYDDLIVAAGATDYYFGHDEWAPLAPGLKTVEDATEIRGRVLEAFERAEREPDAARRQAWLTFVIVGGGATGVELAGALGEIANDTLRHDFRHIDPSESRILLVEGEDRVLPSFPADLSRKAARQLEDLKVTLRLSARVTAIDSESVTIQNHSRDSERLPARTVLWAAGVRASSLGQKLAERTGAPLDRAGRVMVAPDLSLSGHAEIHVIGDLAGFTHQGGKPLPGVAPVAMQQGRYVANLIRRKLRGGSVGPFHYFNKGNLATVGRNRAVADFGVIHVAGFPAWFLWVFVHLMYIVEFENRLLIFVEWVYNYVTRNRGARLITGDERR